MKKNSNWTLILTIVGALVVLAAAVAAVIHFWEDIKERLPFKCNCDETEGYLEDEEDVEFVRYEEA